MAIPGGARLVPMAGEQAISRGSREYLQARVCRLGLDHGFSANILKVYMGAPHGYVHDAQEPGQRRFIGLH